jgi:hypothetical protein
MTPHETISLKIAELEAALLSSHPSMPSLLQLILRNLQADPEVVTLLSSEERSQIVAGLMKQTDTQITTSILGGGKGKTLKKLSVDDI